jgi:hypothetical protein
MSNEITATSPEVASEAGREAQPPEPNPSPPSIQEQLFAALSQLLHEVIEAGFESAHDYNWPKAIADAQDALASYVVRGPIQSDWDWILKVLRMTRDRAQSGTPLHVTRCPWLLGDPREQIRNGAIRMIYEIFETAVVDEPE